MKGTTNIAKNLFKGKTLVEFKKWHKLACPNDPVTAEKRYVELGFKLKTGDD